MGTGEDKEQNGKKTFHNLSYRSISLIFKQMGVLPTKKLILTELTESD